MSVVLQFSDHTKQHCRNKWSMITPEAWTPVIINRTIILLISTSTHPIYTYIHLYTSFILLISTSIHLTYNYIRFVYTLYRTNIHLIFSYIHFIYTYINLPTLHIYLCTPINNLYRPLFTPRYTLNTPIYNFYTPHIHLYTPYIQLI